MDVGEDGTLRDGRYQSPGNPADNIGQSFVGVVAKALDDNYRRYNH